MSILLLSEETLDIQWLCHRAVVPNLSPLSIGDLVLGSLTVLLATLDLCMDLLLQQEFSSHFRVSVLYHHLNVTVGWRVIKVFVLIAVKGSLHLSHLFVKTTLWRRCRGSLVRFHAPSIPPGLWLLLVFHWLVGESVAHQSSK